MVTTLIVLGLVVTPYAVQAPTSGERGEGISYEQFVDLSEDTRRTAFRELSPEMKSTFKRERARRWLDAHRPSLSAHQIAAVERAISFASPELYSGVPSQASREEEEEIQRELECVLGRQQVYEAFTFLPVPQSKPGVGELVDEWLYWFEKCVR